MLFRYLFQSWLQSVARRKVQETVVEAAKQHLAGAATAGAPAAGCDVPPDVCHAAVVFALGVESGGLEDLMHQEETLRADGFVVHMGTLRDRRLAVALSGPGREKAAHATDALIAGHQPRLVVSAGFGGGLSDQLRRNDLVVGTHVKLADGAELPLAADAPLNWPRVFTGRLLTVDRVIRLPSDKKALGQAHEAMVVDMETYAVAEVCRKRGVPFLAVRVIIDAADDELPRDVERLLEQRTTAARLGVALGAFFNRPQSAVDLYKLKENALLATDRLAKYLAEAVGRLPP